LQYHGGTNLDRSSGGPFIATSYDYDAPIDEYGKKLSVLPRQACFGFELVNLFQALFSCHANPKYFLFHPSHQIFRRMRGALNVGEKDN
jgi:hypothetical protein